MKRSLKQTKINPHFPMLWWLSRLHYQPLFGKGARAVARAPPPKAHRLLPRRSVDLTRESGGNQA